MYQEERVLPPGSCELTKQTVQATPASSLCTISSPIVRSSSWHPFRQFCGRVLQVRHFQRAHFQYVPNDRLIFEIYGKLQSWVSFPENPKMSTTSTSLPFSELCPLRIGPGSWPWVGGTSWESWPWGRSLFLGYFISALEGVVVPHT